MAFPEKLNTHQKALNINLDATSYGSFAEIGAGQEVVRWFLLVGGASGTVAKSISAYDKEVSDDLYGSGARYVSKERLEAMLDGEWNQLLNQLKKTRGSTTRFFSFVDTVSARNYAGTNEQHGWVGLRFQLQPDGEPSEILLHINMLDPSNVLQQEAIGILGVNLVYAVFFQLEKNESLFKNVAQDVERRIEVDYAEVHGPAFEGWDQRTILVQLVRAGLAEAVCFPSGGPPAPPVDILHKKALVLAPGSFEHVDSAHRAIHRELLAAGVEQLRSEFDGKDASPSGFYCLSVMPLRDIDAPPEIADLLERIDALHRLGASCCSGVLLFRDRELYTMTALVNRHTKEHVRFVVGLSLLVRVWSDRYANLPGSFLEATSRLLAQNVRLYAYPMRSADLEQAIQYISSAIDWQWTDTDGWVTALELHPAQPLGHLYDYLLASNFLFPMPVPSPTQLHAETRA